MLDYIIHMHQFYQAIGNLKDARGGLQTAACHVWEKNKSRIKSRVEYKIKLRVKSRAKNYFKSNQE